MSYLQRTSGIIDFSQAVISLWFRVPKSSIDAAIAANVGGADYILGGGATIPLLTFGKPQEIIIYDAPLTNIAVYHFTPGDGIQTPIYDTPNYTPIGTNPVDPCYIGLLCVSGTVSLVFNIQMADSMLMSYARLNRTREDYFDFGPGATRDTSPGTGWQFDGFDGQYHIATIIDTSFVSNAQPEYFQVVTQKNLAPDHWHHLLLSFDLTGSMAIGQPSPTSSMQLWYAIDDVDYRGPDNLQPFRQIGDGLDDNNIVSANVYFNSGGDPGPGLFENFWIPATTGEYGPGAVACADAELGLPASANYVDFILPVEMAEFQFFTGVTVDTADEFNRRAFITKAGTPADPNKPVNPKPNPSLPPPVPPPLKGPLELLGKAPDILLHGSGNWIAGKNTGKDIKLNEIGKPSAVDAAKLDPTGLIVSYSPDPSLHGAQSPLPAKPPVLAPTG